jgi:hypothetical protein
VVGEIEWRMSSDGSELHWRPPPLVVPFSTQENVTPRPTESYQTTHFKLNQRDAGSEEEPRSELKPTRLKLGGRFSECPVRHVRIHTLQVYPVQDVESFEAQLKSQTFS